jgi:hypothetical protein
MIQSWELRGRGSHTNSAFWREASDLLLVLTRRNHFSKQSLQDAAYSHFECTSGKIR